MSIQALREKRVALTAKARKLIDENPGAKFPGVESEVDDLYSQIDALDRDIHAEQRRMNAAFKPEAAMGSDWRDGEGNPLPVAFASRGPISAQLGERLPERPSNNDRPSMGDMLRGIAGMRMTESVRATLSEGTDSAGGFTLPQYLQLGMLDALAPVSSMIAAGTGVSMLTEGAKSYRYPAVATIPDAAWRSESGAIAVSEPTFRSVDLVPRSLSFSFKVSRELLMDSIGIDVGLYAVIAQAFAKKLDYSGLRGSGTAPEIRGVLNTANVIAVGNGGAGSSIGTTAYANFVTAMQSMLAADAPAPTAAIMSPRSFATLAGLLDTANQPRRRPPVLENWKFLPTSQIPNNLTVGASTDCSEMYVGDFSKAAFFFREGFSIGVARELYAATGEIGFFCHTRVDLGVLYPTAFAVVTGVRP